MSNKSVLYGCLIIAIALILSGFIAGGVIAGSLWQASSIVPGSFAVTNENQPVVYPDYMTVYEAASYCRIDYDSFERLLNDGRLTGTYAEIPVQKLVPDEDAYNEAVQSYPGGTPPPEETPAYPLKEISSVERVFVKANLDTWMSSQVVTHMP